jgi:hypothetical protein
MGDRVNGVPSESSPGGKQARILEQAIDYALSPNRRQTVPKFLEYDVVRNARAQVQRNRRVEDEALTAIGQAIEPTHWGFDHDQAIGQILTSVSPEDWAVANDLEESIRKQVRRAHGPVAVGVFDCMVTGNAVEETAAKVGISARTVDRTRTKIRAIAAAVLAETNVAA